MAALTAGAGVTTVFTIGTTSVALVVTNTLRRGLRIVNQNANTCYVGIGTNNAATTAMEPVVGTTGTIIIGPLNPNVTGQISLAPAVPVGDIAAICAVTTGSLVVTEW